jgi:DNA-binding GntR family transcriptional regulator
MRQLAHSTASSVYAGLRQKIIELTLKPRDMLVEQKLAKEFGVSRTPIREALAMLASEGLVEISRNRGAIVAPIRVEAVRTAQFVRESLEISVAMAAATQMNSRTELKLFHAIEEQELANRESDAALFYGSDEAMHFELAKIAGLPLVWDYIAEAKVQMDRVRRLSLSRAQSFDRLIEQHRRIITAIARNDRPEIEASLKEHLRQVLPDIEALKQNQPDYFDDRDLQPIRHAISGQAALHTV